MKRFSLTVSSLNHVSTILFSRLPSSISFALLVLLKVSIYLLVIRNLSYLHLEKNVEIIMKWVYILYNNVIVVISIHNFFGKNTSGKIINHYNYIKNLSDLVSHQISENDYKKYFC